MISGVAFIGSIAAAAGYVVTLKDPNVFTASSTITGGGGTSLTVGSVTKNNTVLTCANYHAGDTISFNVQVGTKNPVVPCTATAGASNNLTATAVAAAIAALVTDGVSATDLSTTTSSASTVPIVSTAKNEVFVTGIVVTGSGHTTTMTVSTAAAPTSATLTLATPAAGDNVKLTINSVVIGSYTISATDTEASALERITRFIQTNMAAGSATMTLAGGDVNTVVIPVVDNATSYDIRVSCVYAAVAGTSGLDVVASAQSQMGAAWVDHIGPNQSVLAPAATITASAEFEVGAKNSAGTVEAVEVWLENIDASNAVVVCVEYEARTGAFAA